MWTIRNFNLNHKKLPDNSVIFGSHEHIASSGAQERAVTLRAASSEHKGCAHLQNIMNSVRHIWWRRKEPRSEYNCNKPSLYWCIFPSRSFHFYHYVKHRKNLGEKNKMSLYPDFSLTARQMCTPHPQNRSKGDIFLACNLVPRNQIQQYRPQKLPHQCACYGSQDSSFVLKSSQQLQRGRNPVS